MAVWNKFLCYKTLESKIIFQIIWDISNYGHETIGEVIPIDRLQFD